MTEQVLACVKCGERHTVDVAATPAGTGLREAHNMLRRIVSAYRHPQKDDPDRLDDEIAGTEALLRALATSAPATAALTPVTWYSPCGYTMADQPAPAPIATCPKCLSTSWASNALAATAVGEGKG